MNLSFDFGDLGLGFGPPMEIKGMKDHPQASEVVPLIPLVLMVIWMDLSFICSSWVILKPATVLR